MKEDKSVSTNMYGMCNNLGMFGMCTYVHYVQCKIVKILRLRSFRTLDQN